MAATVLMNASGDRIVSDEFVLASDISIAPIEDLNRSPAGAPVRLSGEFMIGRPGVRSRPKALSAEAAELVLLFQAPMRLHVAVASYAEAVNRDAHDVLRQAFPILKSLIDAKLLVPATSPEVRPFAASLPVGQLLAGGYRIEACLQVLQDTEIYRASGGGTHVAVKAARCEAADSVHESLRTEAEILSGLDGVVNPRLLHCETSGTTTYLILQWCDGTTADRSAARLARRPVPESSCLGEQYAVGAVLYGMVCGEPHVRVPRDYDALLEQIAVSTPPPFHRHGVVGWGAVESEIKTALNISPEARHPDMAAFAAMLRAAELRPVPAYRPRLRHDEARQAFLRRFIASAGAVADRASGAGHATGASVASGTAGIAYAPLPIGAQPG